jgi:uncharacterized protein (TIGR02001 family)
MKATLTILSALVLLTYADPSAALGPLDVEAEIGLYSKYVWRGMIETDEAVLQPVLSADLLGFGAEIWTNLDFTDVNKDLENPDGYQGKFNEVSYTLSYGISLPVLQLGAGVVHYTYPNTQDNATTELFASAGANVLFSPTLTVNYDIDEIDGGYFSFGLSHGVPMSPVADLDFAVALGYGTQDYVAGYFPFSATPDKALGPVDAGPTDFLATVSLPYRPLDIVTIRPSLSYMALLGDAQDVVEAAGGDKDAVIVGITAGPSF